MSEIIFEPFGAGTDNEGEIEALAPVAKALLMPWAEAILAVTPMVSAELTGHQVGMAMPSVTTLYAVSPQATADLLAGTSGMVDVYAPRAAALLTPWEHTVLAEAPGAYANLAQINPNAGFFAAYYTVDPYVSIWAGHWGVDLAESLVLGDATTSGFIITLRERLNIVGAPRSILHTAIELQDALVLRDAVQIIWQVVLAEALALADSGESQRVLVANLIDRLVLADIATTTLDARVTLATVLALSDDVGVAWLAELVETLDVSDALDARITALVAVLERLETTDTALASLTVLANVSESLVLSEEGGSQLDANVVLHEALEFFGSIVVNGDVWSCWLINTESKGVARYTNYPFNSFAKAPWGGYVGATDTGLHMLEGDTDDGEPIHALIRSALTDFGSRHLKRVPNMYLGYTASGPMVLKVIHTSEQGRKVEDWYRVEPRDAASVRESRFKVGRGIASVYLGFELVNVAGADFALDVVEWLPLRLDRRVR